MGLLCSRSDTPVSQAIFARKACRSKRRHRGVLSAAKRGGRGFKSLLIDTAKTKTTRLGGFLFLVRQMGLEPIRSRTRPSNVPVCQFQHCRAPCHYSRRGGHCQFLFFKILSPFDTVLFLPVLRLTRFHFTPFLHFLHRFWTHFLSKNKTYRSFLSVQFAL